MTHPLEFIRLLVGDLGRSIEFYRDVLGMELAFDDGENYASFAVVPGFSLSLFRHDLMADAIGAHDPVSGDRAVLVFATEDVDAEAERLTRLGVEVIAAPADRPDWGIRTVHVRDPDGHLIEINRPLPELA